jgi:putative inorganic carbon (HCO3(-)) transporter
VRSLWILFIYVAFIVAGPVVPFVTTLGYVWVDTFRPQEVAYIILNEIPVAFIMGMAAVGSYVLFDRRSPPRLSLETVLTACMAAWITMTLLWAEVPDPAWAKWNVVFKTLIFCCFIPYVIRSRIQIEAFAHTYVLSLAANFVPFGIKTIVSGGGYGANLGLEQGNTGLGEGGLLSTVCLMAVPMALYLSKYSLLVPYLKKIGWAYLVAAGLAIATAVGTFERSALMGMIVLAAFMWSLSKHKVGFGVAVLLIAGIFAYATSSAWTARIFTIAEYSHETSAYGRILVWEWTINYAATHPFGGGFQSYLIDHIDIPGTIDTPGVTQFARAFHSIYFEVLGEQGYPGLALFLCTAISMFVKLRRIARTAGQYPELEWMVGLSHALQSGLVAFLVAGAFVGIAFQPMFWYFIAMGVSLNAYMSRVMQQPASGGRWSARLGPSPAARRPSGEDADWRKRRAGTVAGMPPT